MAEHGSATNRLEWGESGVAEVATLAEMDELIDRLTADSAERPIVVELVSPNGATISIGVGRSVTVVNYVGPTLDPPYLQSLGDGGDDEVVFFYRGEWSEYPPESAVPVEVGRQALRDFFATGELPSALEWQEV
jgi:hypothetical protein